MDLQHYAVFVGPLTIIIKEKQQMNNCCLRYDQNIGRLSSS
jgi:hypothetical protein